MEPYVCTVHVTVLDVVRSAELFRKFGSFPVPEAASVALSRPEPNPK